MTATTIEAYGSLHEWLDFTGCNSAQLAAEAESLLALKESFPAAGLHGYCPVCDAPRGFLAPEGGMDAGKSFRESLHCESCRSISRHRAAIAVLEQALVDTRKADLYITEQATTLFVALHKRMRKLAGSEFVPEFGKRQRLT
ncbi:MAG TPA: hypothetical protein VET30_10345, partial [Pseudoxanthomonas sp.]|nr:hypothetical protein [Pseudoxanthomonas sp.]